MISSNQKQEIVKFFQYGLIFLMAIAITAIAIKIPLFHWLLLEIVKATEVLAHRMTTSESFLVWLSSTYLVIWLGFGSLVIFSSFVAIYLIKFFNSQWLPEDNADLTQRNIVYFWLYCLLLACLSVSTSHVLKAMGFEEFVTSILAKIAKIIA